MSAVAVIVLLAVWQILIFVSQIKSERTERFFSRLRISLSSRWGVFCWRPRRYWIAIRDWDENGAVGEWRDIEPYSRGGIARLFWNPEMWHDTARQTLLRLLASAAIVDPKYLNVPLEKVFYVEVVRDYLRKNPPPAHCGAIRRQFRVKRSWGYFPEKPAEKVFQSEPFDLDPT